MKRIAITGGIAEGKSTVLGYCREAGYSVCSADEVAREIFEAPALQAQLAKLLETVTPVSREYVRDRIAEDDGLRRSLNRLTHRAITTALFKRNAQVTEVPLLIETCMLGVFDRIWVVTCGAEEQKARLCARIGPGEAARLLRVQLPTTAKTPFADTIIRTNQAENHVKPYVLACLNYEFNEDSC